jgi:major membrane immunogen (membrane-anchored lipoprotein)
MKRIIIGVVMAVFCIAALAAQTYTDGFYFAQDAWNNNMKNQLVLEVKSGKIISAKWNIISLNPGQRDLKTMAQMPDAAAAQKNWAGQAAALEAHLVSTQSTKNVSVAGGPANPKPVFDLAANALSKKTAIVAKGNYSKDGWFYAEDTETDDWHTKNTVLVTIVNGTIVDVFWNGILVGMHSSVNPSKMITSRANQYPMEGSKRRWDQQADQASAELVKVQNPALIKLKQDGHIDGISGVSISGKIFINIIKQALPPTR